MYGNHAFSIDLYKSTQSARSLLYPAIPPLRRSIFTAMCP